MATTPTNAATNATAGWLLFGHACKIWWCHHHCNYSIQHNPDAVLHFGVMVQQHNKNLTLLKMPYRMHSWCQTLIFWYWFYHWIMPRDMPWSHTKCHHCMLIVFTMNQCEYSFLFYVLEKCHPLHIATMHCTQIPKITVAWPPRLIVIIFNFLG